jgi:hypothetical protein
MSLKIETARPTAQTRKTDCEQHGMRHAKTQQNQKVDKQVNAEQRQGAAAYEGNL